MTNKARATICILGAFSICVGMSLMPIEPYYIKIAIVSFAGFFNGILWASIYSIWKT